ncbi:cytochrome P450 [Wolfiporia cocos MD-104 SS10]|uniref:Cytochrome P450 n=1 Tax=Wolfiporia cocos (strain MD-104) TaxID=742152 RepID=A0A2H3JDV9_WOLCO|nr:cytochrome P450 [Wolfiporia cocos MD-104 SS10]
MSARGRHRLPPGPTLLPLIGNALHVPQDYPWLTYSEWANIYGDIIHLDVLGKSLIIINSEEIAKDLLDKRSAKYSDRPRLVTGFDRFFVLQPYNDQWRNRRRIMAQGFSQTNIGAYHGIQEAAACRLVSSIIDDPNGYVSHIKLNIASIIVRATYGYDAKHLDDPMIAIPLKSMQNFDEASVPAVRYLPSWLPGTEFMKVAKRMRQEGYNATWNIYLWCKKNLGTSVLTPSLCASILSNTEDTLSKEDEANLAWSASTAMGGGLDTNMSIILTFILAMIHYPEVQKRAQAEIDTVIGTDKLPTISDRPSLPYVRSVIAETFRWQPPVPLCVVHSMSEADEYHGFHLPNGSMVIPNVWHMLHDPRQYPEPMAFKPERFRNDDAQMARAIGLAFGFGRRACPGSHFAEGSVFAIIATILACCDISPALDAHGNAIIPDVEYTSGLIVFPKDFKCDIKPRSSQARSLLTQTVEM